MEKNGSMELLYTTNNLHELIPDPNMDWPNLPIPKEVNDGVKKRRVNIFSRVSVINHRNRIEYVLVS